MPLSPAEIEYELANLDDSRAPDLIVSTAVCLALACVAVLLRLIARYLSKAKVWLDDYMIIVALIICIGQGALVFYSVHLGAGKHVVLMQKHDVAAFAKTIISMEVLYCVGTATFKFSALLFFHRVFGSVARFTAILWAVTAVIVANNVAEIFLSVFQCTPVHKAWHQSTKGSCVNILLAACIPGAINVLTDLVTVLLPIPMVWGLQMRLNRKIQLVAIFLLSGFVCIASTYRTIVVKRLSHQDATWADTDPIIWAVVENAIGIVSASLPTMRPLYVYLVRGHYCSTMEARSCPRCAAKESKRLGSGDSESRRRFKGSCSSDSGIAEKGGVELTTVEPGKSSPW